jgi:ribonuclease VapC
MFLDASALCAVLLGEVDGDLYDAKVAAAAAPLTSAVAVFETALAVARVSGADIAAARRDVEGYLAASRVELVEIGEAELARALDAFDRFGKGRHPADLNMGDCFAYACAKTHGVPLLFKGDEFTQTDVAIA